MVAIVSNAPAPASYRVQYGDTLSQIALDFYGDDSESTWKALWKANHQLTDPNVLHVHDLVKLPKTLNAATVHAAQIPPPPAYHAPKHSAPPMPTFTPTATPTHAPQHSTDFTVPTSGNMVGIARYLEDHGATRAGAAGIAAGIWGESEGNPESVGSGGFGLIGWTGNNVGLPAGYFHPSGDRARDMAIQLAGVVGYIKAEGGFGPINAAGGPISAAEEFSRAYERPAVLYSDIHYGGAGDPTLIFDAL